MRRIMIKATALTYRNAYSGLSRSTWLLSLIMLINRSGTMVLPFLALYMTDELGLSDDHSGLLEIEGKSGADARAALGLDIAGAQHGLKMIIRRLARYSKGLGQPRPQVSAIGGDQFQGLATHGGFVKHFS